MGLPDPDEVEIWHQVRQEEDHKAWVDQQRYGVTPHPNPDQQCDQCNPVREQARINGMVRDEFKATYYVVGEEDEENCLTDFGFVWDGIEVSRLATFKESHVLQVKVKGKPTLEIYVSRTGRSVRVWKNAKELK